MVNFHPSYAIEELIHQKIIRHLETLTIPIGLKQKVYVSNYRVIDLIAASTALYLAERTLTSKQIEKQINGFTQTNLENIRFNNSGNPSVVYFTLLCEKIVSASFNPYNGVIKLRKKSSFIDLYDLTIKPIRLDSLITEDTLDFHARRLQMLLCKVNIEILPDIPTIKAELARVNGLDAGLTIKGLTTHLVLYKDVLPICITYIPNSIVNNISTGISSNAIDILRRVTSQLKENIIANNNLKSIAIISHDNTFLAKKNKIPSAYIRVQLQYKNLNNLLQPTIEEREISVNYNSPIPIGDQTYDEIETITIGELAWSLTKEIRKDQRIVETTHKRRISAKTKKDGKLLIDKVAKKLLSIIDGINPQDGMDIRIARLKSSKIKVESGGSFFSGHAKRKNGVRVSKQIWFRVKDGEFTSKVDLNETVTWEYGCLKIKPMIPETITLSLKNKLASEIIDHPIADLIGSVKSTKNKSGHTEIKFNLIMEEL